MKKLFVLTMMLLVAVTASAKRDWKGKVIDEKGEPVAYANVAVLSKADSTVVCGAVTEEDGTFNIVTKENDGIMMVAMLGYKTVFLAPVDGMVVTLKADTALLESAAVVAVMPKTKITGEGLQTSVRGSVLENAGSARDVLAKTPGIIQGQDGLEVIGKGAPMVYINGRRVSDVSELDRLQSNEIQHIEVITNPGSQYDATVRAVVRIRTIKRQGEGFGFNFNASDDQSLRWNKGNDPTAALNVNYRTGGVDIFGGVNYQRGSLRQLSDASTASYSIKNDALNVFENKGTIDGQGFTQAVYGNAGLNWQIADNHSVGGKLEWGRTLQNDGSTLIITDVFENGSLVDKLSTLSTDALGSEAPYNLGANLYYNGLIGGKLGVDVNLDYYGTHVSMQSHAAEESSMTPDADVTSVSNSGSRMIAGKAVLSYPIWMGQLQAGTEETFSRRTDDYSIAGVGIPASQAAVKEDNIAAFASYGCYIPQVGQLSAGVRYEHVRYSYEDAVNPSLDLSRSYDNWFPTVSYANVFGPVQLMLNYSAKTRRPNYSMLSGAIRYNSRYIWQSGNAQLQPQISHNIGLTAVYKWITFMVNYSRTDDSIMMWSAPYNDEGVVLVKPRNVAEPCRDLQALVNITPTIGPWTLNYSVGVLPQWFSLEMEDPRTPSGKRMVSFNGKPLFFAQLFNTLTVKGGWQFELGGAVQTPGYTQNVLLTSPYVNITAAIQKTLLKDGSLVLRLEGSDLTNMAHYNVDTDFGSHKITQTNHMDQQRIKFSIRYSFNAAKSKYRGTGAGSDEKARM